MPGPPQVGGQRAKVGQGFGETGSNGEAAHCFHPGDLRARVQLASGMLLDRTSYDAAQSPHAASVATISGCSSVPVATPTTNFSPSSTLGARNTDRLSAANKRVATQANRLFPSGRASLRANECSSAAAFSGRVG